MSIDRLRSPVNWPYNNKAWQRLIVRTPFSRE
jgi:hypothetical protein